MTFIVVALSAKTVLLNEEVWVDDEGGAPLRCCLRDSCPGERIRLGTFAPVGPVGAYRESGPVFLHGEGCGGAPSAGYPDAFRTRAQVFRAYDKDGRICGGRLVKAGHGQERAASELLSDPQISFVHSRNVVFGCYMFAMHARDERDAFAQRKVGTSSGIALPGSHHLTRWTGGGGDHELALSASSSHARSGPSPASS